MANSHFGSTHTAISDRNKCIFLLTFVVRLRRCDNAMHLPNKHRLETWQTETHTKDVSQINNCKWIYVRCGSQLAECCVNFISSNLIVIRRNHFAHSWEFSHSLSRFDCEKPQIEAEIAYASQSKIATVTRDHKSRDRDHIIKRLIIFVSFGFVSGFHSKTFKSQFGDRMWFILLRRHHHSTMTTIHLQSDRNLIGLCYDRCVCRVCPLRRFVLFLDANANAAGVKWTTVHAVTTNYNGAYDDNQPLITVMDQHQLYHMCVFFHLIRCGFGLFVCCF